MRSEKLTVRILPILSLFWALGHNSLRPTRFDFLIPRLLFAKAWTSVNREAYYGTYAYPTVPWGLMPYFLKANFRLFYFFDFSIFCFFGKRPV